ncbi:MAG: hypothetical protein GQ477_03235 [Nanohaloarchaea archaeon]|nr:hypothetical protein [Candidatus Nanohaloarchaea archaeon]
MNKKELKKIVGLNKTEFDNFINPNMPNYETLQVQSVKLIPIEKLGDEQALTSVFLASLKLVDEFREKLLNEIKFKGKNKNNIFLYREAAFNSSGGLENSRVDGLIIYVSKGIIVDAAFFEMKNKSDKLTELQINKYIEIAKKYNVPKIVTISNEFVTSPTQSPIKNIKLTKRVDLFHFSWTYILTEANLLLFKDQGNNKRIKDEDQVAIMQEVVSYFEHNKSGIMDFSQMNDGWITICKEIKQSKKIRKTDSNIREAILSWIQEEKNMMLKLSSELGVLVTLGNSKFKNNIQDRINRDVEMLCAKQELISNLKIKNVVSDIHITLNLHSNNVQMFVSVKTNPHNSIRANFTDIRKQIKKCDSDNERFEKLINHLSVKTIIRGNSRNVSINFNELTENSYKTIDKTQNINEFRIIFNKTLPFEKSKVFIKLIEEMLFDFYKFVVLHLKNPQIKAPKPKNEPIILMKTDFIQDKN